MGGDSNEASAMQRDGSAVKGAGNKAKIDFSKINFLIVDDSKLAAKLVFDILSFLGARHVERTNNPEAALTLVRDKDIDVVITEWQLKGMSGLDFLDLLRNSPLSPNRTLPVVMLTANSEQEHVLRARDHGITEFLAKPFTGKGLFNRLVSVIAKPRDFISTDEYFGPDRRRQQVDYNGPNRREREV